jgi:hypothetical protein
VFWLSIALLVTSLIVAVISAWKSIRSTPTGIDPRANINNAQIVPILEALKGLIEALGKAPAWFALFLAGIFLFWLSGEIYVKACKPVAALTKTANDKLMKTEIIKTINKAP